MQCPTHDENSEPGCAACFEEACEAAIAEVLDLVSGAEAKRMPSVASGHAVWELSFEGQRLFPVTYGAHGLGIPNTAETRIREFVTANRANVEFWDDVIFARRREADEDPGPDADAALHRALRARGVAGRRLDIVEHWSLPKSDRRGEAAA